MNKYLIESRVVFDDHLMTLSEGDAITALTANETELLLLLMDGVASKQAVIERIWESKGMFVSEGSYHQLVRSLRVKLEERGVAGGLIKTLPRLGLRFVGAAERLAEPASTAAFDEEGRSSVEDGFRSIKDKPAPDAEQYETKQTLSDVAAAARDDAIVAVATDVDEPISNTHVGPRRPMYFMFCAVLVIWAGVLSWLTFSTRSEAFQFRFQQTIDGVHYFSDGRMEQKSLLQAIGVTPPKGSFVYEIELGMNDWLAVCQKPIDKEPELCDAYFVQRSN
ncbi:winged helix-turn-helix domain-containing protein [Burkholderia ubonensis]|uniref:winged helix-turn-helix domain-containing protein n=1 Tax=Burkholderia ubonensis TaxID=101571 RepID=UPI00075D35D9|nr:winged helix-turn-helix domain-containing protein [Burkholderia ubonensis]KWB79431.1 hypothetical protein WL42_12485 [Burkholderia ubonensis]